MKSSLYYCLAAFACAKASPKPQTLDNPQNDVALALVALAFTGIEGPSESQVPVPPSPVGNAALWTEALTLDANRSQGITNQYLYAALAWVQSTVNTSNSNTDPPISYSSKQAQGLQKAQMYPANLSQPQALDPATTLVEISPTPQQTIKSFGISGAWWPNDLNFFPPAKQQNLSTLLFSENWLYVSGYRYNMGASGGNDAYIINPPLRGVESFMKSDGTYDWTRDGPGIYYLKAAQAAKVSSITFFVNAQPSYLTAVQAANSSYTYPCGNTLDSYAIPAFVEYIETVVAYWSDQDITIDYVSPMNEPDDSFQICNNGQACSCQQEGQEVHTSDRLAVFQQLRAALANSTSAGARSVKIMGDETSQITSQAFIEYASWLPDTLGGQYLDAISVHMYDWPDDVTLKNYRQLVINSSAQATPPQKPPPIKMSEISSFSSALQMHAPWSMTGPARLTSEWDPSMDNALDMARMIWQWMTLVNAESWDWWTVVSKMIPCTSTTSTTSCPISYQSGNGWNDAFIYIDPNYATNQNYNFYLTKRFWVFKHFTTFIRPGAVRYDIPNDVLPYGTVAMASLGADNTWNTVFINRNATAQTITLQLPGTGGKLLGITQTTADADWQSVTPLPPASSQGTIVITLPARAVLSVQFTISGAIAAVDVEASTPLAGRGGGGFEEENLDEKIGRKSTKRDEREETMW